jgi:hypothetical protein
MREGDLKDKPYAAFWNPRVAPLSAHAKEALLRGPVAAPLLPALKDAPLLLREFDSELENGFGIQTDGSLHVAIRIDLPEVSPAMIDWWFGWHSAEPQRYKLWHPRAHVHAQWSSPETAELSRKKGRERYVGRTSLVDEYVGSEMSHVGIHFLPPAELGFEDAALSDDKQATVVCARISFADYPLDVGYLIHHVRRVAGGAEMRSRFFLGGSYAGVRAGRLLGPATSRVARMVRKPTLDNGRDLLVHCSEEMSHLATFLPKLHAALYEVP